MKTNNKIPTHGVPEGIEWAEHIWKLSLTYIRTVVDTVREPFVILDEKIRVIAANETFYRVFQVPVKDTENKLLYELGDGQWDISPLRKLLEDILPRDTFFKGFEVNHEFPGIGHRVMLLNARRVILNSDDKSQLPRPIILLAMEDITEITAIAKKLATKTEEYERKIIERTEELEASISELAALNKTVSGFTSTIYMLTSVIEKLQKDIQALKKN